jgi:hypothetical protein
MNKQLLLVAGLLFSAFAYAQVDSTAFDDDDEDFSKYADAELAGGVKRYATSKVFDLSPNKLISIGYDYQGAHKLTNFGPDTAASNINGMGGMRIIANIPVISKTNILWSIGANYWRMNYNFESAPPNNNFFTNNLYDRGLTTIGINTTVFKPFNERQFILGFVSTDANGDFNLTDKRIGEYLLMPTYTVAAFYGIKRNDRSMIAYGLTRTYRAGNQTIFPLILLNHTFPNRKWGIEMLLPSRFHIRRNFNPRNLLFAGFEMEGNTYFMPNRTNPHTKYDNLVLRRSEIRPRIIYEKSIWGFVWLSVQAGYRVNFNFDVDRGDFFRYLGDPTPFTQTNQLGNTFYFNFSINLVSP